MEEPTTRAVGEVLFNGDSSIEISSNVLLPLLLLLVLVPELLLLLLQLRLQLLQPL
jgi:hypothetical protein